MSEAVSPLLVIILLINLFALGTTRLRALIDATAWQGVVLGILTLLVHHELHFETFAIAVGAVVIKALVIPFLLTRAMRDVSIRREVEPFIGPVPSLALGGLGTALSILFSRNLPLTQEHAGSLLVPAALSTTLTGFLVLTTRRKAITQVVGYLLLENGIFIMGLCLLNAMPFLIEFGVLLDLLVGIFVMGIIINHISREVTTNDIGTQGPREKQ